LAGDLNAGSSAGEREFGERRDGRAAFELQLSLRYRCRIEEREEPIGFERYPGCFHEPVHSHAVSGFDIHERNLGESRFGERRPNGSRAGRIPVPDHTTLSVDHRRKLSDDLRPVMRSKVAKDSTNHDDVCRDV